VVGRVVLHLLSWYLVEFLKIAFDFQFKISFYLSSFRDLGSVNSTLFTQIIFFPYITRKMPIYVCSNCDYETSHKGTMIRHLKKDLPCARQRIIVNLELMKFIKQEGLEILKLEQDTAVHIKELMQ